VVIVRHPTLEFLIKRVRGVLANTDNRCADLGQTAHKVALGGWKEGLNEEDVHGGMLLVPCGLDPSKPAPLRQFRAQSNALSAKGPLPSRRVLESSHE
jgi:hypothetical protein